METITDDRGRRWLGVGLPAVLLLVGSTVPLPPRRDPGFGPYGPDKVLHLVGHAWLAAALVTALDGDGGGLPRDRLLAVTLSIGYGVWTERLQDAVPGREFERADVVAGVLGSLLGAGLVRRSDGRRCPELPTGSPDR